MSKTRRHPRIRIQIVALLRKHPDGLTSDNIRELLNSTHSKKSLGQILKSTPGIASSTCKVHDFRVKQEYQLWVLQDETRFLQWMGGK